MHSFRSGVKVCGVDGSQSRMAEELRGQAYKSATTIPSMTGGVGGKEKRLLVSVEQIDCSGFRKVRTLACSGVVEMGSEQ